MKKLLKKILISFGVFSLLFVSGCKSKEEEKPKEPVQIRENSVYAAPKNPTDEIATVYNELSDAIQNDADEATKATLVAVNFAYDFFTLYNKESSSDIGGMDYLPNSKLEEFSEFATTWFYQNYDIILNLYDKENLPYVIMHEVVSANPEEVVWNDTTYDGYRVNLILKYKESDIDTEILKTNVDILLFNTEGVYIIKSLA